MKDYLPKLRQETSHSDRDNSFIVVVNRESVKKIVRLLIIGVVIFIFIKLFPYVKSLFISIGISFVIAFFLYPIVDFMENRGFNRAAAVIILFLVLISLLAVGLKFIIPSISDEVSNISQFVQNEDTDSIVEQIQILLSQRIPALNNPEISHSVSTKLHDLFQILIQKSFNVFVSLASSFMLIITIPFITFFFLKDGQRMKKYVIQCVPNRYFEMSLNLIYKSIRKLGSYIRGQLLVSTVIGTLSVTALYILGIPYFFIIGVVAGLANMIPYFGPWVGATPGVIVAFIETGSTSVMISVIIAFALIQLLDNILISPLIVSKSVQIHPLLVILVLLVGSSLAGILGMLIAVPVFAVIQVVIKEIIWSFQNYRLI